jgi:uncharacterized OB-fold protein
MPRIIPPNPDRDDEFFWNGVKEGKLLILRCADCKTLRHPPVPMCPNCGSVKRDAQESTGRGTIYTWIRSHHPTEPDAAPRVVVLVELEEGIRMVSNLQGVDVEDVRNGMPVEVFFQDFDGVVLPQFRLAGAQPQAVGA